MTSVLTLMFMLKNMRMVIKLINFLMVVPDSQALAKQLINMMRMESLSRKSNIHSQILAAIQ